MSEIRSRLTRVVVCGEHETVDLTEGVHSISLAGMTESFDPGGEPLGADLYWQPLSEISFTLTLRLGRRSAARAFLTLITGRGGPWKPAHARRYPRGRRRR